MPYETKAEAVAEEGVRVVPGECTEEMLDVGVKLYQECLTLIPSWEKAGLDVKATLVMAIFDAMCDAGDLVNVE